MSARPQTGIQAGFFAGPAVMVTLTNTNQMLTKILLSLHFLRWPILYPAYL
ncbi:hypothetical protein EM595_0225 [Duffyella gerundensis]|jgi:hypothetical protein|uniref:Uncharacterized protein n=1 Tax=Duffyella gerundensis TaxID=1619313 RepID=A0A0U5KXA0_9GAMM|nr:hypothetical protein EM595_0225 [Duffyella gerundensis]